MKTIVIGGYLAPFFKILNERGIRYCVLRNYAGLPQSTGGSDVDMWVHADDVKAALNVAYETENTYGYPLVSTYGDTTAIKLCFQREDDGVQFDIFCGAIYYRNHVFIEGETIMRHTRNYNGVCVLDDDFGGIIAFLKEILNNGTCSAKYVSPVMGNKTFTETYIRENLRSFDSAFAAHFCRFINNKQIDDGIIANLAIEARKALSTSARVSKIGIVWAKIRRIFKHPGYVIAFDERCKQSVKEELADLLERGFHHGVTICRGNPDLKQVVQTFFKAKVLLVDCTSYGCWLHPKPDIVVDASLSQREIRKRIIARMAHRFRRRP